MQFIFSISLAVIGCFAAGTNAIRCNGIAANADMRCCFACELMVNELSFDTAEGHVRNSQEALVKLQADCSRMAAQFESVLTCRAWVQLNYVQIWNHVSSMVQQGLDPHARTICRNINQCPTAGLATATTAATTMLTEATTPYPVSATDCLDVYRQGNTASGVYTINPPNYSGGPFPVLCDMNDGGGWTVIQRRVDGTVPFWNKTWPEYKNGFNNGLTNNLWLGNDKIHALSTKDTQVSLQTDLWNNIDDVTTQCPTCYWFDVRSFYIDDESNMYQLHVTPPSAGNATLSSDHYYGHYMYNNNMYFTTVDRDHDGAAGYNCAHGGPGAWWHNACTNVQLNGLYGARDEESGLLWICCTMLEINPTRTQMKIRRNS